MTKADEKPPPTKPHERRDINVGAIYRFVIVLSVVAIIVHLLIWGLFEFFKGLEAKRDPRITPLAVGREQAPPGPRLQVTPVQDYQTIRQNEQRMLETYQWVDQKNGVVRIPIEQAMKQVLQKNLLKARPSAQPKEQKQ